MGISVDDPVETAKWAKEIGITFPLLSDKGGKVSKSFGLLNTKTNTSARAVAVVVDGNLLYTKIVATTEVPNDILPWVELINKGSK